MRLPRKHYWLALAFGAVATLATGLVGGRELDGIPGSLKNWGRPIPWLSRTGPTQFGPNIPVRWSIWAPVLFFPIDTLFWSVPGYLLLRWRCEFLLQRMARRKASGQCECCGYDLRGSSGQICPECGESRASGTDP